MNAPWRVPGGRAPYLSLRRMEKAFLLLLPVFLALEISSYAPIARLVVGLGLVFTGTWAAIGIARRLVRKAIWRLRNRLIVAYLFIAVVPVLLISILVGTAARDLAGQVSVYLVQSEFERRMTNLRSAAEALARTPAPQRATAIQRLGALFRERYPGLEIVLRDAGAVLRFPSESTLDPPARDWPEVSGVVARTGQLYEWARAAGDTEDVTVVVPITRPLLEDLAPGLGPVSIVEFSGSRPMRLHESPATGKARAGVPPPVNMFDLSIRWATNLPVAIWETPQATEDALLGVRSRLSAVVRQISRESAGWRPLLALLYTIAVGFLLVEIVSVIIGVSITRAVTAAVHDLYEGTLKVQAGDFAHRIPVQGNDQIAELSGSFNRMTENLERLLIVAKERERLQADLEIAREVQNQLLPRAVPVLERLRILAVCRPARMVSGDFYDYQPLADGRTALAIGDVAGKGISAALLMATLQSTLRTHLRGGEMHSPSSLVSKLNVHLHAHTSPEKYATFCFAVYDDRAGRLIYTNAGHLPPLLIRRGEVKPLDVNGMVVGAFPFARYDESTLELEQGDLLVCYTDGVTEPENEYSEMFGEGRLIDVLKRHACREPEYIAGAVVESVERFTGSPELQDDLTLLLAQRL